VQALEDVDGLAVAVEDTEQVGVLDGEVDVLGVDDQGADDPLQSAGGLPGLGCGFGEVGSIVLEIAVLRDHIPVERGAVGDGGLALLQEGVDIVGPELGLELGSFGRAAAEKVFRVVDADEEGSEASR
jgi:hypothetical protein